MSGGGGELEVQVREGVATLTLARPERRNALNAALVRALSTSLKTTAADPDVRVVVLRGSGPDFCAGADLDEVAATAEQGPAESLADARRLGALFASLRSHPRPIVAVVQGRALAGGCGLVTACDLALLREDAKLGYPEVHLGFVPAMVMALLRRKVGEGHAFELAALGRGISATRAVELGLATRVLPAEGFEAAVDTFVRDLASLPSEAVRRTKELLYELDDLSVGRGLERGAQVNAEVRRSEECKAGVRAFLARSERRRGS